MPEGLAIGLFAALAGLALVLGRHRLAKADEKERHRLGIFAYGPWYTRAFERFSALIGAAMILIGVVVLVAVLA